jgi:hypothetical protein
MSRRGRPRPAPRRHRPTRVLQLMSTAISGQLRTARFGPRVRRRRRTIGRPMAIGIRSRHLQRDQGPVEGDAAIPILIEPSLSVPSRFGGAGSRSRLRSRKRLAHHRVGGPGLACFAVAEDFVSTWELNGKTATVPQTEQGPVLSRSMKRLAGRCAGPLAAARTAIENSI